MRVLNLIAPRSSSSSVLFVTGPRRSLCFKLSDIRVYAPQIRAHLETTARFYKVVVLRLEEGRYKAF